MSTTTGTDRIEKQILLDNPRSRVWRALTDSEEFGTWFGVKIRGPFVAGRAINGQITIKGYEHVLFDAIVEAMEPERLFSFRWRPYAIDPKVDYAKEPRTLVTFTLEERDSGTLLTVVESGFDVIPAARRIEAFKNNAKGWAGQMVNIQKHLAAQR